MSLNAASLSFFGVLPVSNTTRGGFSSLLNTFSRVVACCVASTSVGAMNAPWWPFPTAASSPSAATIVLPHPTSPCSSRSMGVVPDMSWRISSSAVSCPRVSEKSRTPRSSSHIDVLTMLTPSPPLLCALFRSCNKLTCNRTSSSNASRSRAATTWSTVAGA